MPFDQVNPLNVSPVGLVLSSFVLAFSWRTIIVESGLLNENIAVVSDLLDLSLSPHLFNESVEQLAVDDLELGRLELMMESWVHIHVLQTLVADAQHLRVPVHDLFEDLVLLDSVLHLLPVGFQHEIYSEVVFSLNCVLLALLFSLDVL